MLGSSLAVKVGPAVKLITVEHKIEIKDNLISFTLIKVITRPTLIEMIELVPTYKEKLILSNLNYYELPHFRIYRSNIRNKYPLLRVT